VLGVDRATVIEGVEVGDAANAVVAHLGPTACFQTPVRALRGADDGL